MKKIQLYAVSLILLHGCSAFEDKPKMSHWDYINYSYLNSLAEECLYSSHVSVRQYQSVSVRIKEKMNSYSYDEKKLEDTKLNQQKDINPTFHDCYKMLDDLLNDTSDSDRFKQNSAAREKMIKDFSGS